LTRASAIAIGPGLGQSAWSQTLLDTVMEADKPLVVDADALNMLAKKPLSRDDWVLTPHPGEAARMLDISTREIQQDRYSAAAALHSRYGGVCVLKGAGTLVQSEAGTGVCMAGNPGMSTGGMGDVLTGVIAGLLAQGLPPLTAAELGVCLHARAGDAASVDGERGMLATDLLPHLRRLVNP
jgi:ADP-dependent NAD(P)H-hydrate dehydratase / NAD(P)H-hydrate epimerase